MKMAFRGGCNLPNLVFRYRKIAISLTRLNVVRGCYTYATFMRIIRAGSIRSVGMDVGGRLQRAGAPESRGSHSRDPPQTPEILRRAQPPRRGHQGFPQIPLQLQLRGVCLVYPVGGRHGAEVHRPVQSRWRLTDIAQRCPERTPQGGARQDGWETLPGCLTRVVGPFFWTKTA